MKAKELDALIDSYLEGRLSEAEAGQLSDLLEESEEARSRYWEMASIHGLLEQSLQGVSLKAVISDSPRASVKSNRFFRWAPMASAAAGVVIGIFGATMVRAYTETVPDSETRKEILLESFEGGEPMALRPRFPDRAGDWFGDLTVAVSPEDGISPEKGMSVARFSPVATRKYSYARYIIDLDDPSLTDFGKSPQLEVKASFSSKPGSLPARYQIRLAAFSQPPEEVRAIWNRESVLFDTVLQHTGRNYIAPIGQEGWKKLHSRIDLPPGSRCVVISLGVAGLEGEASAGEHYLDAVRARLISRKSPRN